MKFFLIILLLVFILKNLGYFFDITQKPINSDVIICMGGGHGERLKKSLELLERGFSKSSFILSSDANEKERKRKILTNNEEKKVNFLKFSKNTYEELFLLKDFAVKNNYKKILIVSSPTHSRRIDFLIKNYINLKEEKIEYKLISSEINWWNKENYYTNKKAINSIIHESLKLVYNIVKYSFINKYLTETQIEAILVIEKKILIQLNKMTIFFSK